MHSTCQPGQRSRRCRPSCRVWSTNNLLTCQICLEVGLFGHKNETAPAHSSAGLPTGASHGVAGAGIQDPAYAQPGVGSHHQGGIGGKIHQEEAAFSGHNGLQQGGLAGQQPLGGQAGFQQGQAGVQQPGGFQQGATLNDPQRQGVLAHGHQNDHASHHHGKQAVGAGVAAGGAAGMSFPRVFLDEHG